MRFMMLMIPKGYEKAQPGAMPDAQGRSGDDEVQRIAAEGRRPAGIGWPAPTVHGSARFFLWREASGNRRAVYRDEGGCRWYWMIQVKSKEEAIEWAKRCPGSENEVIEVRQVQEFTDFPADVQKAAAGFPEMQAQSKQSKGS